MKTPHTPEIISKKNTGQFETCTRQINVSARWIFDVIERTLLVSALGYASKHVNNAWVSLLYMAGILTFSFWMGVSTVVGIDHTFGLQQLVKKSARFEVAFRVVLIMALALVIGILLNHAVMSVVDSLSAKPPS